MNNIKNAKNTNSLFRGGKTPTDRFWKKIKLEMIALILKDEFDFGKVYSIAEMTQIFSCGKSTAQKVLEALVDDKVLIGMKGVGFFVNNQDESLQDRLKTEYQDAMVQALDDYLFLCEKIGMSKEEIEREVEKRLSDRA